AVHAPGRIPHHDVPAQRHRPDPHQAAQADDHARLRRHDRLQRVVGAQGQSPRREQLVEGRDEREQHQQRAAHREQRHVELVSLLTLHLDNLRRASKRRRWVTRGIAKARPSQPTNDSGTTVLGGTSRVSAVPTMPSYIIDGLPPVVWVSTTCRHSDPPGGMTIGSWLALVVTVNGLVRLAPDEPYVSVHVLTPLGTVATNPVQLEVSEMPALSVTVSLVFPLPPVQYIVKLQVPAATVWAGRLVKPKTVATPPAEDWMLHGVAIDPAVWSSEGVTQSAPPCKYSGLPAACTVATRDEPQASAPNASSSPVATIQPIHLFGWRARACIFGVTARGLRA